VITFLHHFGEKSIYCFCSDVTWFDTVDGDSDGDKRIEAIEQKYRCSHGEVPIDGERNKGFAKASQGRTCQPRQDLSRIVLEKLRSAAPKS
jgi:hypothetical protein